MDYKIPNCPICNNNLKVYEQGNCERSLKITKNGKIAKATKKNTKWDVTGNWTCPDDSLTCTICLDMYVLEYDEEGRFKRGEKI